MFSELVRAFGCRYQACRLKHMRGVELGGKVWVWGKPVVTVHPEARVFIGEGVRMRSHTDAYHGPMFSPVRLSAVLPGAEILVGRETRLFGCTIHAWRRVEIGSHCLIAANVAILDAHGHSTNDRDWYRRVRVRDEPLEVVVGDYVWIGLGCIITKGVHIGQGAIIGAGSVVTTDVSPFTIVAGSPARVVRQIVSPASLESK
jgi:acetyltransferase-like isoleucine patch superfamily enzyme